MLSSRISPGRLPQLCVSVQAGNMTDLLTLAERAARESNLIELRLDAIKPPTAVGAPLRSFLRSLPHVQVIATCRKQTYGGQYHGSAQGELHILLDAARAGCAVVDLELQSAERLSAHAVAELRQRANLIVSYHDYKSTPALEPLWKRLSAIPADIYKLVTTANQISHNATMLQFLEAHSADHALVGFCMGEAGLLSRLLALRSGALFTFAALDPALATASGQPDLATMRELYRMGAINRATRVFGVLGHPLEHSLSPQMHSAAFQRVGLNAIYLPLASRKPTDVLDCADEIPLSGLSVTHPYKSAFLDQLERLDALAEAVGAINTVVRSQGKLYGYNTDIAGVVEPLGAALPLRGAKILVVGAGGAARAAVFGLRSRGAHVFIYNRTRAHAQALASAAKAKVVSRTDLKKLSFQALVHATPVGQYPKVQESLLESDEIHAEVVFDLVYNPLETELARRARAAGARVINGVEMFVHQGARQFELWTGKPAPLDAMRAAVLKELGNSKQ